MVNHLSGILLLLSLHVSVSRSARPITTTYSPADMSNTAFCFLIKIPVKLSAPKQLYPSLLTGAFNSAAIWRDSRPFTLSSSRPGTSSDSFSLTFSNGFDALSDCLLIQHHFRRRIDRNLLQILDRALAFRIKTADGIHLISPQFDTPRIILGQRKYIP